jgi:hypothetical protein
MMKRFSILLTIIILAFGGMAAWHQHRVLGQLQMEHPPFASRLNGRETSPHATRVDRSRADRARSAEARDAMAVAIDLFSKVRSVPAKPGSVEYQALESEFAVLVNRMEGFSFDQLREMLRVLLASEELADKRLRSFADYHLLRRLVELDPKRSPDILLTLPDLDPDGSGRLGEAFHAVADRNPDEALAWLKENIATIPDRERERLKNAIISKVSESDPSRAFRLIAELHPDSLETSVVSIVRGLRDDAARTAALKSLREYLTTISEEPLRRQIMHRAVAEMVNRAAKDGFEEATRWIAAAGLRPEELDSLAAGFEVPDRSFEPARWIVWLGETLSDGKADPRIRYLVSKWTREGHRAVGEWLSTMPESPIRTSSIIGFVDAVAPHEPESAMQWAAVLPDSEARQCAGRLFSDWIERDSQRASMWLNSAPDSAVRHAAARVYAEQVFSGDPEKAMHWLETIPAGPEREETLRRLGLGDR